MEWLEIEKKHSLRREEFLVVVNLAALHESSRLNLALISIDQ